MKNEANNQQTQEKGRMMVSIRLRPFNDEELVLDNSQPIEIFDNTSGTIVIKREFEKKTFQFDNLFDINSTQKEIFDKTSKHVIDGVLSGYNGTIFSFGQSGTGKTYTMMGQLENKLDMGIAPRSFEYLFENIKVDDDSKYNVYIAYIQIYMETVSTILNFRYMTF